LVRFPLTHLIQVRREWIPYLILLISLICTIGVVFYYANATETSNNLRFKNGLQRTRLSITDHFNTFIALLRGGTGLYAANGNLSRKEFKAFVDHIQLQTNYPGIQGIGHIKRVSQDELPVLIDQMHQEGFSDFAVHPNSQSQEYYITVFIEPLDKRNQAAIGFNSYADPTRRAAMMRAGDTGLPALSGKVTLVQEIYAKKQAGFVVYVPIYKGGLTLATLPERRNFLEGFIYSPFRSDDVFKGIVGNESTMRINFKIYDGKVTNEKTLLYDSAKFSNTQHQTYIPHFTKTELIDFAGHNWTISYSTTPEFDKASSPNLVIFLLLTGIGSSFFLFYISRLQYKARVKAELSEQKLRESKERYKQLVASTKVIPWEADAATGEVFYVGPQARHLLGFPVSAWYSIDFWEKHVHPDDKELAINAHLHAIKAKQEYEIDYRMIKKNGKVVWVHNIIKVVRKPHGKKVITGILIDVTEREMLIKQKEDFVSIATHELKTPVTSIKAYAQVLLKQFEKAQDKQSAGYVAIMDAQLNKLINLIEDLLDATRFDSGKLRYHEEWFDSNTLIYEIVKEVQLISVIHKIKTDLDETQLLFGDRDRIGQVLTNFLTNAIKYSPDSIDIIVKTKKGRKKFSCLVQDFGVGIAKESRKKIFERFFRVTGPHEDAFAGLGLGLYLSAEIIKRHKGKIYVESTPGKGSIFYFTLPILSEGKKTEN
jgi:PAS domain S-box-containing protein